MSKQPREARADEYDGTGKTMMADVMARAERTHTVNQDIVANGILYRSTPIIQDYYKWVAEKLRAAHRSVQSANGRLGAYASMVARRDTKLALAEIEIEAFKKRWKDTSDALDYVRAEYQRLNKTCFWLSVFGAFGWSIVVVSAFMLSADPATFFSMVGWHG